MMIKLTENETAVVELVAKGLKNSAVAAQLNVTEKTVKNRLHRTFRKLGVRTRGELTVKWLTQGAA